MVEDRERLERFLARMCRMGFLHGDSQGVGFRAIRANDLMKEVVKCGLMSYVISLPQCMLSCVGPMQYTISITHPMTFPYLLKMIVTLF